MFSYQFPMAAITADVVLLRPSKTAIFEYEILLIKRKDDPYAGCLAFPGGYVNVEGERIINAAMRELKEETGVDLPEESFTFLTYADDVERDTRGRVVSFVYLVNLPYDAEIKPVAGDDADSLAWYPLRDAINYKMAFDHAKILKESFVFNGIVLTPR